MDNGQSCPKGVIESGHGEVGGGEGGWDGIKDVDRGGRQGGARGWTKGTASVPHFPQFGLCCPALLGCFLRLAELPSLPATSTVAVLQ